MGIMTIAPIERLINWWISELRLDPTQCNWCKERGETFLSEGGYRYCSMVCEAADAEEDWEHAF